MGRLCRLWPALLGAGLAVLALGPALAWGFVLRYDLVFVPDPPILPDSGGFPRAVPSDLVVALLSRVLPGELVQKGLLAGIFVLAASGAAALVPPERRVARLVAAVFYAWNIYLAQRLLLGQWALLLGVAALPWAVRATAMAPARPAARAVGSVAGWGRLVVASVPAAVGGFQAMLVTALTVAPIAVARRRVAVVGVTLGVLSLPWLVPALTSGAVTDPAGVDAFAARADGPFGVLGSLLSLGGIWNAEAGVPGQEAWWLATGRLLLALAGLYGYARMRTEERPGWWGGLAVAAAAGFGVACLGAFAPGVLKWLIGAWAGFGPLRDGQAYLAPMVLVAAVGLASLLRSGAPAVVGLLAPVLVLPTFAWGASGRLAAVPYPQEWRTVQRIVNADPAPGALLSLPWGAHRAFAWNGGRVVLDPAAKMFERRVVRDDTLLVGLPDGGRLRVRGEDPRNRLSLTGVRYVLVAGTENRFPFDLRGWTPVHQGEGLTLLRR
ncbi:hypothetical protein [Nonomuraea sp. SBT364]|uniref:hypothetical protein n=1 Tax=Nonomuraea sp. SBT364 TaxID=1580530 RepID=UPI00066D36AC|nr:hypothetical protein [Nonomuraea sp. SBT364]